MFHFLLKIAFSDLICYVRHHIVIMRVWTRSYSNPQGRPKIRPLVNKSSSNQLNHSQCWNHQHVLGGIHGQNWENCSMFLGFKIWEMTTTSWTKHVPYFYGMWIPFFWTHNEYVLKNRWGHIFILVGFIPHGLPNVNYDHGLWNVAGNAGSVFWYSTQILMHVDRMTGNGSWDHIIGIHWSHPPIILNTPNSWIWPSFSCIHR